MCSKTNEDLLNTNYDNDDSETETDRFIFDENRRDNLVFIKKIYRNTEKSTEEDLEKRSVLYAVMSEQGKMLAVTDTQENAQFYCKNHNYEYSFSV